MDPAMPSDAPNKAPAGEPMAILLAKVRQAQRAWGEVKVSDRIVVVRRVREALALHATEIAASSASLRGRPLAEVLSAEVLPLLEACRFLEREAGKLLSSQRLGRRGRPLWLSSVETEIRREPRGVVLVIGPGNYPLLLPGVQILQALAAGNGVIFKPAPGTGALADAFRDLWISGGLPSGLFQIAPEYPEAAHEVIREGVDFVVLTGSVSVGEAVLRTCAERLTPSVMELSGCDAVIVCEDADVELAAAALGFGLRMNAGATCIAPRRVYVARRLAERLEAHLVKELNMESFPAHERLVEPCRRLLVDAESRDAAVLAGGMCDGRVMLPLVISGGTESRVLLDEEIFAPVLVVTFVDSADDAIELARRSNYALGASVFSRDEKSASRIAERLNAGVVLINDMIVPTADPRLPFGGRARSGFGVTRGAEGLLTMTVPKVITFSSGRSRPHFAPVGEAEAEMFAGFIASAHGRGWQQRWRGMRQLWTGIRAFTSARRQKISHDLPHEE